MIFANAMEGVKPSDIREILKLTENPEIISFAGGIPDPSLFPLEEIKKVAEKVLAEEGRRALQYNSTEGYLPLRNKITLLMKARGIQAGPDNVLITSGSQQGIDFSGKIFLNEGDGVVCESPTYSGAVNAFVSYRPKFIEITTDDQGMNMDELENALQTKKNIKMIYVVPDFQNPTGRTWSIERRKKLVELANQYDIPIIEDDPYAVLRFQGKIPPAIKSFDSQERVIYLGTFSKTLCPGLRIGWVAADGEVFRKYVLVKQAADIHSNSVAQREIDGYLDQYNLDEQVAKINSVYKKRRDVMSSSIRKYFPKDCICTYPEGGMFIWAELPPAINTRKILEEALKVKVAFIPGGGFFPNGGRENSLRLNYSNMPEEKIEEGIKRLGSVLTSILGVS